MFRHSVPIAAVLLVLSAAWVSAEDYSLSAYLQRVEQQNLDLALAQKELDSASEGVVQARSALLPSVAVQGGYNRNLKEITQPYPVASLPTGGPLVYQNVRTNYDNELSVALSANQTIFNATSLARYQQAKTALELQKKVYDTTRLNILGAAKKLYAQVQLAQKAVTVLEASEQTAKAVYTNTQMKFNAGVAKELDLLMAEVDWKTKIPALDDARKNVEVAMIALKNLARIPQGETVTLTEDMENIPPMPPVKKIEDILARRPDFAALLLSKDLADLALRSAYGSYLPTVSAGFLYTYGSFGNGTDVHAGDLSTSKISITATVPLFAGFYRSSLVKSATIEKQKADIKIDQQRNSIERDLTEVQLRLGRAQKSIDTNRIQVATAKRAHDLAVLSYTNGVATQLTVSQAATQYEQAQLALYNALYDYRSACYDWEIITGLIKE